MPPIGESTTPIRQPDKRPESWSTRRFRGADYGLVPIRLTFIRAFRVGICRASAPDSIVADHCFVTRRALLDTASNNDAVRSTISKSDLSGIFISRTAGKVADRNRAYIFGQLIGRSERATADCRWRAFSLLTHTARELQHFRCLANSLAEFERRSAHAELSSAAGPYSGCRTCIH